MDRIQKKINNLRKQMEKERKKGRRANIINALQGKIDYLNRSNQNKGK